MHKIQPRPFATRHVSELVDADMNLEWVVDDLLPVAAAAILGGVPKAGKSFTALDVCVGVASGTACLGRFTVQGPRPVLILQAEDPPPVVNSRLQALAAGRGHHLKGLPIEVVKGSELPVRLPEDLDRLGATLDKIKASLVLLDPLIRCHRSDENSASEMSIILDGLRGIARATKSVILLVHHARKAPAGASAGTALRGSSDLAAFGDTNLYLRKIGDGPSLELRIEQRAIPSPPPLRLRLLDDPETQAVRFEVQERRAADVDAFGARILAALAKSATPMTSAALRQDLGVRNQTIVAALRALEQSGRIRRSGRNGWMSAP
jgi:hypothetical protein